MSEKKKFVELNDKQLEQASGGKCELRDAQGQDMASQIIESGKSSTEKQEVLEFDTERQ